MSRISCILMLLIGSGVLAADPPNPTVKDRDGGPLPTGAIARLGSSAFRANEPNFVVFSADSSAVLARDGGKVIAWDAKTGAKLAKLPANTQPAFEFEGTRFPSNRLAPYLSPRVDDPNKDKQVLTVVDKDGTELLRFKLKDVSKNWVHGPVTASPDWSRVAAVSDTTITVYDVPTGREVARFKRDTKGGFQVRFTPDGKSLFVHEHNADTKRYSLPDGKELTPLQTKDHSLDRLEVSPDSRTAVVAGYTRIVDGNAMKLTAESTVYDIETGKPRGQLDIRAQSVCYPNADTVIVSDGYRVIAWNVKTLGRVWEIRGSGGALALSPDGKRLAVGGEQQIQQYDPATGKRLDAVAAHNGPVVGIRFSGDGKTVTTFGERETMAWDRDGKRLRLTPIASGAAFDGVLVEGALNGVRFRGWDAETTKEAWTIEANGVRPYRVLSHDGARLLVQTFDQMNGWSATVYDGPTGKQVAKWDFKSPDNPVPGSLVLSGDGRTLIVSGRQTSVYDTDTGKIHARLDTSLFPSGWAFRTGPPLACSHDGSRLAAVLSVRSEKPGGGVDDFLVVFDVKTKKELVRYPWTLGAGEYGILKFRPDGRTVVAWNPYESKLLRYDAEQKAEPVALPMVDVKPQCVAFDKDGKTMAIGYNDGTTLLWDSTAKPK